MYQLSIASRLFALPHKMNNLHRVGQQQLTPHNNESQPSRAFSEAPGVRDSRLEYPNETSSPSDNQIKKNFLSPRNDEMFVSEKFLSNHEKVESGIINLIQVSQTSTVQNRGLCFISRSPGSAVLSVRKNINFTHFSFHWHWLYPFSDSLAETDTVM